MIQQSQHLQRTLLNLVIIFLGLFFIIGSEGGDSPIITILGENPVTVRLGDLYVDAGATATDTEDGEIDVVTTGLDLVNTSIAKTYTITYTATDQDDNETVASRDVIVKDIGNGVVLQGRFIDSAVAGLEYSTPIITGITTSDGTFEFRTGETAGFHIGGVELGSYKGQSIITPVDITPDASSARHFGVINRARLLQSLDSDGNPENGITITAGIRQKAKGLSLDFSAPLDVFEKKATAFIQTVSSSDKQLVSQQVASSHLEETIRKYAGYCSDKETETLEFSQSAGKNCSLRRQRRIYFEQITPHMIRQLTLLSSAIDKTITAKKQADLTIKALAKIAEIQGIISKNSTADKFKEAMKVAVNSSQKQLLLADIRVLSQTMGNIDPEIAEIWVDSTVAYLTVLATGNPQDAYATLVQQSLGIVNNLWASNSLNNKVERVNEYILAINALKELLEDGSDLYTLTTTTVNDLIKKQASKKGWNDYILSEDYELDRARKQLFILIRMIGYYEKEIDLKLVREGKDIVIFNTGKSSVYDVGLSDMKCSMNNSFSISELKVGEYKKLKNYFYINKKGCKTELYYHLSKQLTEGYQYKSVVTKNDLESLAPVENPYVKNICPDINKSTALKSEKSHQEVNIKKTAVGIRYFSADACDSVHHDNDPFKPSNEEEVHNLVDLPSHFLYSLEDYQWDNTKKHLKQRTTAFFGDAKIADQREPLIIIHGWQGGYDTDTAEEWFNNADSAEIYWEQFIKYMQTPAHRDFFAKNYKPYVYHYPSFKHITYNGRKLKQLISSLPELKNKKLTILAHSMGGLVARSWVEEHDGDQQLNKLITLATPHHGSPAAIASWVDSSSWFKSLSTPGALDMMWDNYDGILEKEADDLGMDWLKQRETIFGLGLNKGTQLSPFDLYYLSKVTKVGSASNPWLAYLNGTKRTVQDRYYRYAGYVSSSFNFDSIKNDFILGATSFWIDIIADQYESDGVVPDSSGFNNKKIFGKKETVYIKPENEYFIKIVDNNDRFIWDIDHELFRIGLNNKFITDYRYGNVIKGELRQKIFISALLKETVPDDWQGDNAYDPLWFMVKQDLGYFDISKPQGIMLIKTKKQNILTWKQKNQFATVLYTDKTTGKTTVLKLTLDLGKPDAKGSYMGIYYHNNIPDNANYTYALVAKDKEGNKSGAVAELSPINFSVAYKEDTNTLTWEAIATAQSYDLRYTSQAVVEANRNYTLEENIKTFTFEHKNIAKKATWYYQLRYKNAEGDVSAWGAELSVTSPDSFDAPKNLKAIAGDKQIILTWDSVTDAEKYTVYMAEETGITPENYSVYNGGIILENKTSPLNITELKNGTTYYFVVTATKETLQSKASNEVSAKPKEVITPTTGKLNDTGITRCADGSSNDLDCPVAGYPNQDAEHGVNKMSFTKIASGKCVKDNNTGLIWEVKQDKNGVKGDSLHDADDSYTWYNPDNSTNGGYAGAQDKISCFGYKNGDSKSYCNTQAYVQRVNFQSWCGYSDWRLPTFNELYSLVDYSMKQNYTIDISYFPNTVNQWYWSSSQASNRYDAWLVDFHIGKVGAGGKAHFDRIRLVRNEK